MIDLDSLVSEVQEREGIEIDRLDPGTKLVIKTRNSTYNIEVVDKTKVLITGGKRVNGSARYSKPTSVIIVGATFGGSVIKVGWIGEDMNMEIYEHATKKRVLVTTPVKAATITTISGTRQLWGEDTWMAEGF